jgi:hypothetical protein
LLADRGCSGCDVSLAAGTLTARVAGSADLLDSAYALTSFAGGGEAKTIRISDEIRLADRAALAGDLVVLQLRDARDALILELYVRRGDHRLKIRSEPGGLSSEHVDYDGGVFVPPDGVTTRRIEVSLARATTSSGLNQSVVVLHVDGVRTLQTRLVGGRARAPRFLRAGILSYGGWNVADPVEARHTGVTVAAG